MERGTVPIIFFGNGVTLAADRWVPSSGTVGRGTVVLLHGDGQTRRAWAMTGQRLAQNGWTAIALDARGHGGSQWAPDGDYRINTMVADVRSVISTLSDRPVLVGSSMGGIVAMLAVMSDPALARALALVDVAQRLEPGGNRDTWAFIRSGRSGFATLGEAKDAASTFDNQIGQRLTNGDLRRILTRRDGRWFWQWDPGFLHNESARGYGDDMTTARSQKHIHEAAASLMAPRLIEPKHTPSSVAESIVQERHQIARTTTWIDTGDGLASVARNDNDSVSTDLVSLLDSLDVGRHGRALLPL